MDKKDKIANLKKTWFGAITVKDEAIRAIREASSGFYAVAGIDILIGLFLWRFYIVEGIIYLVLSLMLRFLKSRATAIVLLTISLAGVFSTVSNFISKANAGGRNILLALIVFGISIRAVQATFKFHKFPECVSDCKKLGKYMLVSSAILIPVSIFGFLFVSILPYITLNDEAAVSAFFENPVVCSILGLFVILCIAAFAMVVEGLAIKFKKPAV